MGKLKITLISDTHNKHKQVTEDLTGGDILIHAGDISSKGYEHEVHNFLKWYDSIEGYKHKIFIAGNHDFLFEQQPEHAQRIMKVYETVDYLMDSSVVVEGVKVYGSPWQPEFHSWAFNLPRNGEKLEHVWNKIPDDVDILVTHGPVHKVLDYTYYWGVHTGCEKLEEIIFKKNPSIHVCGHIHEARGAKEFHGINFFNASVLDLSYNYVNKPYHITWDTETNSIALIS